MINYFCYNWNMAFFEMWNYSGLIKYKVLLNYNFITTQTTKSHRKIYDCYSLPSLRHVWSPVVFDRWENMFSCLLYLWLSRALCTGIDRAHFSELGRLPQSPIKVKPSLNEKLEDDSLEKSTNDHLFCFSNISILKKKLGEQVVGSLLFYNIFLF